MTKTLPNKFISVKEFAALAGVSTQSVYKQVGNRLVTYATKVGNRWMIDISALSEVYGVSGLQPIQPKFATDSTENSTKVEQTSDVNQELIQLLKDQLVAKDRQIEMLQKQLDQEQHLRLAEIQNHQLQLQELQVPKKQKRTWWFRKSSE